MSEDRFREIFNDHPVHAALGQLNRELQDLPTDFLAEASEQDQGDAIPRLERVLDYIAALLGAADPALVTPQMLTGIQEPLEQISSLIPPLRDNREFAHLQAIHGSTEGLLNAAVQVAPALGVWAKADLTRAASSLGEAATTKTHELQQRASQLEGRLGEISETLDQASASMKQTSEERLNELQGRLDAISKEAQSQHDRIEEAINSFGSRFDAEQGSQRGTFEEEQERQRKAFEEAEQEFSEARTKALSEYEEKTDTTIKDLVQRGRATLGELDAQREEAKKLVDLVATSSTAGAFGKEANEQKRQADQWRRNAIRVGLLAAGVGLAAVIASFILDSSPSAVVAKVAAVALLIGIAGYAAGQSGQHRRREQRAKRLELELTAFGPFAEPLEPEEKLKARKDFIERLFVGDPGDGHHQQEQAKFSEEQLSALATLMNVLQAIQKPN